MKNNKIASIEEMEFDVILMYANRMLYINIRFELGKMDDVFLSEDGGKKRRGNSIRE